MAHPDIRTRTFWKDTAERVLATFLQVLLPALGIEAGVSGVHEASWMPALSIAAAAAVLALIKCLIAGLTGGSPSAVKVGGGAAAKRGSREQDASGETAELL